MKHLLLTICAALLLNACATAPIALEPQSEATPPGMARVYLLRDSAWWLRARSVPIKVNGKEVGGLANGSSFFVNRVPGDYRISVKTFGTPAEAAIDVHLEADKRYYVQVGVREEQYNSPSGPVGGALGYLLEHGGDTGAIRITLLDSGTGEALWHKLKK